MKNKISFEAITPHRHRSPMAVAANRTQSHLVALKKLFYV
jgi:hypothetical protein